MEKKGKIINFKNSNLQFPIWNFDISILLLFIGLIFLLLSNSILSTDNIGKIISVQETVEIQREGETNWQLAKINLQLQEGDKVKTAQNGKAIILFEDGTTLKINNLSIIEIKKIDFENNSQIDVKKGQIWAKIKTIKPFLTPYTIYTPTAAAGVRGTEFDILVTSDESTSILTVVDGEVAFYNEFGSVTVSDSQQSKAIYGRAPSPPSIVDTNSWIKWTAEIQSVGLKIEYPFYSLNIDQLKIMEKDLIGKINERSNDFNSYLNLAKVYIDAKLFEEALSIINEIKLAPAKDLLPKLIEDIYEVSGRLYLQFGQTEKAEKEFSNLLQLNNQSESAFIGLSLTNLKRGNIEEATTYSKKAEELNQRNPINKVIKGITYMRKGNSEEAKKELESATEIDSKCYQALGLLSQVYLYRNEMENALNSAKKAVEIAPESSDAHTHLARVFFFLNDIKSAKAEVDTALFLNPLNSQSFDILANIYILENSLDLALSSALKSVALDPDNPFGHDALGVIYSTHLKYEAAILEWKKAIELDPSLLKAYIHLSSQLTKVNNFDEALYYINKAIEIEPNADLAYSEKGRVFEIKGDLEEAESNYKKALSINPYCALNHSRLASFYMDRNRKDDALNHAITAVSLEPDIPFYYVTLGIIYYEIGNWDAATSALLQALYLDPTLSFAKYKLGIIYGNKGKIREAISEIHTSILNDPRVIFKSEYRGKAQLRYAYSEHNTSDAYFSYIGQEDMTRLNYSISFLGNSSDGFRVVNSSYDKKGGALTIGYKPNYKNSFYLYSQVDNDEEGKPHRNDEKICVPLPPSENSQIYACAGPNALFDSEHFNSKAIEFGYRRFLTPSVDLMMRMGFGKTKWSEMYVDSNFLECSSLGCWWEQNLKINYSEGQKNKIVEAEVRSDIKIKKNQSLTIGGALLKSRPKDIISIGIKDIATANEQVFPLEKESNFIQKSLYSYYIIKPSFRSQINLGVENVFHNKAGSNLLFKTSLNYKINRRFNINFLWKENYRLSYYPQFQPTEAWSYLKDFDLTTPGQFSESVELSLDKMFKNKSFIRTSYFLRNIDSKDQKTFSTNIDSYYSKGFRVEYEKQITKYFSTYFEYVYSTDKNNFKNSSYYKKYLPYYPKSKGTVGIFYFPNSQFTLRLSCRHIGERFIDSENTLTLPKEVITDFALYYEPSLKDTFFIEIKNVFNSNFMLQDGYPEQLRTFRAGVNKWF